MAAMVLWAGKSRLNRKRDIVVYATGHKRPSANKKTGAMIQYWVVGSDGAKHAACPASCHSLQTGTCYAGACSYVRGGGIKRSLASGTEGTVANLLECGRPHRLTAIGDPASLPVSVWRAVFSAIRSSGQRWTGYTHAWRTSPHLRDAVMASVDSPEESAEAQGLGWRTFRKIQPHENLLPGEIWCPASPEGGDRRTCETCGACNGSRGPGDRRVSIAIRDHGPGYQQRAKRALPVV